MIIIYRHINRSCLYCGRENTKYTGKRTENT